MAAAIYRQQKVLSHFPVFCWIDCLLMIKNCLIESGPPCTFNWGEIALGNEELLGVLKFLAPVHRNTQRTARQKVKMRGFHLRKAITPWPQSASDLYRPSDRRLSAKLVPTFCGYRVPRGQRDESLRPYSRISRPEPLLFLPISTSVVLTRLSGPRSRPTTFFSLVVPGNRTRDLRICSQEP
jgi:hypothetical protein